LNLIEKGNPVVSLGANFNVMSVPGLQSVGEFFMLDRVSMDRIPAEVKSVPGDWRKYANSIGIPETEQERMGPAFRF
jgi:hypothetical protein